MPTAPLHRCCSMWQRAPLAIFAMALLVRSVFILTLQNGFYFEDSLAYHQAATNLLAHGTFGAAYDRPPMYALVLAGIYALFGQHIVAIRLVQAVMGACIAVVIALIGRHMGSAGAGTLAGVLWSVYPLGVFIAGLEYPVSVTTLLLATAVLCMMTHVQQTLRAGHVVLSGLLCGAAALAIPATLAAALATTLWLLYWQPARRVVLVALFLLGVALPLTPWTIRNLHVYGHLVLVDPRLPELLSQVGPAHHNGVDHEPASKLQAIWQSPGAFAARTIREFGHFWDLYPTRVAMSHQPYREALHAREARVVQRTVFSTSWTSLVSLLSVGPAFLFALIGTWAVWWQKERRPSLSLLCMTILSFALGYSLFFAKTRYRLPVEPYIIILSAYGLTYMWSLCTRQNTRARLGRVYGLFYPCSSGRSAENHKNIW